MVVVVVVVVVCCSVWGSLLHQVVNVMLRVVRVGEQGDAEYLNMKL